MSLLDDIERLEKMKNYFSKEFDRKAGALNVIEAAAATQGFTAVLALQELKPDSDQLRLRQAARDKLHNGNGPAIGG
jgi:hypothetical protein